MAHIDFAQRQITLRFVWFGATGAGSSTNIRQLHRLLRVRDRSDLQRVGGGKDRQERSWSFSCTPEDTPTIQGFDVRVELISVPAGPTVQMERDLLVQGLDGAVFVADARAARASANLAALLDVEGLLLRQGIALADLPLIIQVNHTDAPTPRPTARVLEEIDPFGLPSFEAIARRGTGLRETWEALLGAVTARLCDTVPGSSALLPLTPLRNASREWSHDLLHRHIAGMPTQPSDGMLTSVLPATAEIVTPAPALAGQIPVRHLRTTLQGGRFRVEGVFRRSDGEIQKLAVLLDTSPPSRSNPPPPPTMGAAPAHRPSPPLIPGKPTPGDLSQLAYGVIGTTAGLISGLSLGFLLFA